MHKKVLQYVHIKRVSRMSVKFGRTFVPLTTSNQFESHIFGLNFLELVAAAQDYDILHLRHFPEIPEWPKLTFSSPQTFKLSSGELMVIRLVTWYPILVLGLWYIYFLFQNTRKAIRLSVTKLQTHLNPPPAGRQLDWGGGCSTGILPFKDNEKSSVAFFCGGKNGFVHIVLKNFMKYFCFVVIDLLDLTVSVALINLLGFDIGIGLFSSSVFVG